MLLKEIIDIIESVAPRRQQEAWDNSGLQVGDVSREVHSVLLSVDVSEAVVAEAIKEGCDMILSHHPLLFHGLKQLTGATPQERCVAQAIRHNIAIYSSHTSMDKALRGVSGRMAEQLGLQDIRILVPSPEDNLVGLGIIGTLPKPVLWSAWLKQVQQVFGADYVRYTEPVTPTISRVALCGGAGAEFIPDAIAAGADTYLSADMKYHDMQAAAGQIMAVDIDHWISEHFTRDIFAELLRDKVEVRISQADASPVHVL
ncbi:MAG: Nif3-like dinuclear metal center hexameric protein [Paludibacteraceae bacterium]|nr:Nif3-like dinuclear metal center hexameric protein [Paludibacteraceae bacterium]